MVAPARTTPAEAPMSPVTCSSAARMFRFLLCPRRPTTTYTLMAMAARAEAITTTPCTGSGWARRRTASMAMAMTITINVTECASALFRVAPWSVIRSMNSSYPPAKALNGLTPPIFSSLQIGKKHPVAEPFVADLEHRQPVPVQEQQQSLDPGSERFDAVRRQPDVARYLSRAAGVEPAFAGQEVGGGQDAGRAASGEYEREVGGSAPRGDKALHVPVRSVSQLSQSCLPQPGSLLGPGRI